MRQVGSKMHSYSRMRRDWQDEGDDNFDDIDDDEDNEVEIEEEEEEDENVFFEGSASREYDITSDVYSLKPERLCKYFDVGNENSIKRKIEFICSSVTVYDCGNLESQLF